MSEQFKFFHNRIVNPVSGGLNFQQWVEKITKEAAAKKATKTAESSKEMGETSGAGEVTEKHSPAAPGDPNSDVSALINNDPNYQKGESVDGKKKDEKKSDKKESAATAQTAKKADCGKEMGESDAAGKETEKHTPAAPADEKSDVKTLINNDPNYQKGESVSGKEDQKDGSPRKDKGGATAKGVIKATKTAAAKLRKVASLNREEKLQLFAELSRNPKNPIAFIEAMVGLKIANMTKEEKQMLRDFWLTMFDEDYVEKMLADR